MEKAWSNATVAILAGGWSLTQADVDACRDRARVIAIKNTIELAPWADVLYACDSKWWKAWPETASFAGPKYGLETVRGRADVTVLRQGVQSGLEEDPGALATGQNSGYQAINLAVHLGASRIVLLGYDMRPSSNGQHRWHVTHRYHNGIIAPPYQQFLRHFASLIEPLARLGVSVINATPSSALDTFPKMTLAEALA
jgi:hypothetical protein